MNFHDDPTHVRVVPVRELAEGSRAAGLETLGQRHFAELAFRRGASGVSIPAAEPEEIHRAGALAGLVGLAGCASGRREATSVKPKLLVVELWGLGDLVIATPFLRAASERYDVTLLAKPYAQDLQPRLWPDVRVVTFVAPWTAFKGKYRLWRWPWRADVAVVEAARAERFDVGLSGALGTRAIISGSGLAGCERRLGFPRLGSQRLSDASADPTRPHGASLRVLAHAGRGPGTRCPPARPFPFRRHVRRARCWSTRGAGQPIRVWPLERYHAIVQRLRKAGHRGAGGVRPRADRLGGVQAGEAQVATPRTR